MNFFQHIQELIYVLSIERIIGFFYMMGILGYLTYLSIKHKNEFWEAIRGTDNKLEIPELIIAVCMIIYPNLILADAFLGLHASDGVFWSIDAIIAFALTGRVAINKFSGDKEISMTQNKNIIDTMKSINDKIDKTVNINRPTKSDDDPEPKI